MRSKLFIALALIPASIALVACDAEMDTSTNGGPSPALTALADITNPDQTNAAPDLDEDQPQGPAEPEDVEYLDATFTNVAIPAGACVTRNGAWFRSGLLVRFANGRFACQNGRWIRSASTQTLYYMCADTAGYLYLSGRTVAFRSGVFTCTNGRWARR